MKSARFLRLGPIKNWSFCARPKVSVSQSVSPGNSTCVTDIGRSVRVSRKLGRVGRSVRVSRKLNSTCVTDMDSIFGVRICRHRKYKAIPYLNDTYRTPPQHVMHTHMADPLTSQCS